MADGIYTYNGWQPLKENKKRSWGGFGRVLLAFGAVCLMIVLVKTTIAGFVCHKTEEHSDE